jgi:GrpB-like predicted nucleotidyltransferase (UPF0157 family)
MSTIEIVAHDPRWTEMFLHEREMLRGALEGVAERIEHNGSTSVPGLAAKPVIDIQISVRNLQPMDAYRAPLLRLGYTHVPHPDDAFCPFFHRPQDWPHTHHVHVVKTGGEEEMRTLAFRDYLRDHPDAVEEYAALKRSLAAKFEASEFDSQQRYAEAKTSFIENIILRARSMGYPRNN